MHSNSFHFNVNWCGPLTQNGHGQVRARLPKLVQHLCAQKESRVKPCLLQVEQRTPANIATPKRPKSNDVSVEDEHIGDSRCPSI